MNADIFYLIPADAPFSGSVLSRWDKDLDAVAYTFTPERGRSMTLAEYVEERGPVRIVSPEELDKLTASYIDSIRTAPSEIDADRYNYALEVLPPAQFGGDGTFTVFHISEHITGDLVEWYGRQRGGGIDRCLMMRDRASIGVKGAIAEFRRFPTYEAIRRAGS